jgi:hypothetical protein
LRLSETDSGGKVSLGLEMCVCVVTGKTKNDRRGKDGDGYCQFG